VNNKHLDFSQGFTDSKLRDLYLSTYGDIAYVDESYSVPSGGRQKYFYILTATLVKRENLIDTRKSLLDISGSNYWHTFEKNLEENGKKQILEMAKFLADYTNIITIQTNVRPDDTQGEHARKACFGKLFEVLFESYLHSKGMIVLESRAEGANKKIDNQTISFWINKKIIPRSARIYMGTPRLECLLWAPDVVSWSTNRLLFEDNTFMKPITNGKNHKVVDIKAKNP